MSDQPPNTGPSHETLANLKSMLPSFIKGMAKKRTIGKGIAQLVRRPRKCCKVCGLLFDHAMLKPTDDIAIEPDLCGNCGPMLKDGCIALVCGEKYAVVKDPELGDMAGQIVRISPNVMDAVEKKFGAAKGKREHES